MNRILLSQWIAILLLLFLFWIVRKIVNENSTKIWISFKLYFSLLRVFTVQIYQLSIKINILFTKLQAPRNILKFHTPVKNPTNNLETVTLEINLLIKNSSRGRLKVCITILYQPHFRCRRRLCFLQLCNQGLKRLGNTFLKIYKISTVDTLKISFGYIRTRHLLSLILTGWDVVDFDYLTPLLFFLFDRFRFLDFVFSQILTRSSFLLIFT